MWHKSLIRSLGDSTTHPRFHLDFFAGSGPWQERAFESEMRREGIRAKDRYPIQNVVEEALGRSAAAISPRLAAIAAAAAAKRLWSSDPWKKKKKKKKKTERSLGFSSYTEDKRELEPLIEAICSFALILRRCDSENVVQTGKNSPAKTGLDPRNRAQFPGSKSPAERSLSFPCKPNLLHDPKAIHVVRFVSKESPRNPRLRRLVAILAIRERRRR
jgi:hypothetical protein